MANVLEKSRLWLGERTPHLPPCIPESPCPHVLGISLPGTATLGPSASQTTWLWKPWEWGLEVRTSCRKCVSQSEAWSVARGRSPYGEGYQTPACVPALPRPYTCPGT